MNIEQLEEVVGLIKVANVPLAMLTVLAVWVGGSVLARAMDDLGERFAERRLVLKRVSAGAQFVIYGVLALTLAWMLLDLEEESKKLVFGGLIVALGFALQDLAKTVVAGILLLFDAPFQVGDRIAFGGYYGEVKDIGLRSVRLVTLDDNLVTIPNSEFLGSSVASANAGALDCMVVVAVPLRIDADVGTARRLLMEVAATSRYVFLDKPIATTVAEELHGERFVVTVNVKAYVFDTRFEKAFSSDITTRGRRALREAGVPRPSEFVAG